MPSTRSGAGVSRSPSPKRRKSPPAAKSIDVNSKAFNDAVAKAVEAALAQREEHVDLADEQQDTESDQEVILGNAVHSQVQNITGEASATLPSASASYQMPTQNPIAGDIDQGIPVDCHLSSKQRLAIISHSFVEFPSLIKKQHSENKPKFLAVDTLTNKLLVQDQNEQSKSDTNVDTWVTQFTIYSTALCRAQPYQSVGLFHYMDHIRFLAANGYDWERYDITFRRLHESDPNRYPFTRDLVNLQLNCAPSNPLATPKPPQPKPARPPYKSNQYDRNQPPFPFGTCWTYQFGKKCSGCDWPEEHKCCYCGGDHGGISCRKNPNSRSRGEWAAGDKKFGDPSKDGNRKKSGDGRGGGKSSR